MLFGGLWYFAEATSRCAVATLLGEVFLGVDEFVVGGAVGFALAARTVFSHPELVELLHDWSDECGVVGEDTGLEVAAIFAFRAEACSG